MSESLQDKTIKNALWSLTGKSASLIIGFVGNIILARLLSVDDYGCFGILLIFTSLADILIDSGLGAALVQKQNISKIDCSTVFVSNLFLSVFLALLLILFSTNIASYFNIPILSTILKVESIALIIRALYIIPVSLITKSLDLQSLAKISTLSNFISIFSAVILAYCGAGIWSLVAKSMMLHIALCVLYWKKSNYKISLKFSKESFKSLFGYGIFITIASLLENLFSNITSFILGKKFSVKSVGYYTQANSLGQIPIYSLSSIAIQTLFPTLSLIQNEKDKLIEGSRKAIKSMSFVAFPMITLLIVVSDLVIVFFYSEKWINAVPFLQLISVRGLINSHIHINITILKSTGNSKSVMNNQIFSGTIGILLMLFGMNYGIWGFMCGNVVAAYVEWIFLVYLNAKINKYGFLIQLKDMLPSLSLSISVMLLFNFIKDLIILPIVLKLIIVVISYLSFYILLAVSFRVSGCEILHKIRKII